MTFEGLVLKREVNFLLYAMSSGIHFLTSLNWFEPLLTSLAILLYFPVLPLVTDFGSVAPSSGERELC